MDIKPKCPICKKVLSNELLEVLAEGNKIKQKLGNLVRDLNREDYMCQDCFNDYISGKHLSQ